MFRRLVDLKLRMKIILVVLALAVMIPGGILTESSFAQVGYPGASAGGIPLSFDVEAKRADFITVRDAGKLDQLVITQFYDLGIILGTLLFFTSLTLLLVHAVRRSESAFAVAATAFAAFLIAPLMDLLENIFLLIALGDFENRTASLISSIFTLGKASFFSTGWLLQLMLLAATAIFFAERRSRDNMVTASQQR